MKVKCLVRFAAVISVVCAAASSFFTPKTFSQMFDWEYSARLPFATPKLFIGGGIHGIKEAHSAQDFSKINENFRCGNYQSGTGTGFFAYISGEYWFKGTMAFGARAGYSRRQCKFIASTEPLPFKYRGETLELKREFSLSSTLSEFSTEIYGKWLLGETHFHVGASLSFNVIAATNFEQSENIISPEEFQTSIRYGAENALNLPLIIFNPALNFGYDAELGKGVYATPFISIGTPLLPASAPAGWRIWSLSCGIQLNYGLNGIYW